MQVGTAGTKITDDYISLKGTAGIDIEGGGGGTLFKDLVTMQQGLAITSGTVAVEANASVSLDADTTLTLTADTSVRPRGIILVQGSARLYHSLLSILLVIMTISDNSHTTRHCDHVIKPHDVWSRHQPHDIVMTIMSSAT